MRLANIKLIYLFSALAIIALLTNVTLQTYYYINFDIITKNKADEYFSSIVEQVQGRVETTQKELQAKSNEIAYSRLLQEYLDTQDKSKQAAYFPLVVDYLSNVIHSTDYMKSIRIVQSVDPYIGAQTEDGYTMMTSSIFKSIESSQLLTGEHALKKPIFLGPYAERDESNYYYAYVEPIFKIMPGSFSFEPIAFVVFVCNVQNLQSLVDTISISDRSVLVFSFNDNIVAANRSDLLGESLSGKFQPELDQAQQNNRQGDNLVKVTPVGDGQWKILLSIPLADITTDTAELKQSGLVISIVETVFFLIVVFLLIRAIYAQISQLLRNILLVSREETGELLKVQGTNEIGIITRYINGMLGKIEEANQTLLVTKERLYITELEKKQSEVNALHSQINPHFLYNTLECVRSIAKHRKVDEIVSISTAMAHIFRYSIKADEFVTLREELDIVQSYFNIMSIRFQDRFRFVAHVEEHLLDCRILKMILQPIVENAVYHGLENTYRDGTVTLTIKEEGGGRISVVIEDDGAGIPAERLAHIINVLARNNPADSLQAKNRSMGLVNIANRISLVYGPTFGLTIDSIWNQGTRVRIEMPDQRQSDEEVFHE